MTRDIQAGSDRCPADAHNWLGDNPHATFEQSAPAVGKKEPLAFANPCESGAKKASEDAVGMRMPELGVFT